ncbi:MAG: YegS/Rv2252/BmrU family lipid kinase [Firmicutes bacterium]|nr:YegS/Rv2252/BmrU family lipid kinase [Bacillota bacterium]
MKRNLIIMNPCSGKKKANKYLTDIVDIFTKEGYISTVMTTTKSGDGIAYAAEYAGDFDLVTAIGGDGTFNEVAAGVLEGGHKVPLGYIASGSCNDFANSLKLPSGILAAARNIVKGSPKALDLGSFNDRKFSYVASFGAFTQTSYSTPQNIKNALGHVAYVLEGASSIASIRPIHMKIEADGKIYEDDYIFGAISNSTSLAGILTINPDYVDMSDGLFEMLLVKSPKNILDLTEIVHMLTAQDYNTDKIEFINAKEFKITTDGETPWSLDGEYQEPAKEIEIKNLHEAVELMITPPKKVKIVKSY